MVPKQSGNSVWLAEGEQDKFFAFCTSYNCIRMHVVAYIRYGAQNTEYRHVCCSTHTMHQLVNIARNINRPLSLRAATI